MNKIEILDLDVSTEDIIDQHIKDVNDALVYLNEKKDELFMKRDPKGYVEMKLKETDKSATKRTRAPNGTSSKLDNLILGVFLATPNKVMTAVEVLTLVEEAGWTTNDQNRQQRISQALANMAKKGLGIERHIHGSYRLAKAKVVPTIVTATVVTAPVAVVEASSIVVEAPVVVDEPLDIDIEQEDEQELIDSEQIDANVA